LCAIVSVSAHLDYCVVMCTHEVGRKDSRASRAREGVVRGGADSVYLIYLLRVVTCSYSRERSCNQTWCFEDSFLKPARLYITVWIQAKHQWNRLRGAPGLSITRSLRFVLPRLAPGGYAHVFALHVDLSTTRKEQFRLVIKCVTLGAAHLPSTVVSLSGLYDLTSTSI
jgi:hypothetical protein